jgi:ABC-type sugar transport system ATPase subunit
VVATGHELEDLERLSSKMMVLKDGAVAGIFESSGSVLSSVRGLIEGRAAGGEACS